MKIKRLLLSLLALTLLLFSLQPGFVLAEAASETPQVLLNLMQKFPHKAYWNHVGSPTNNPDGVTDSPCPNHIGCSWTEGACTCNSFLQAIQCMGFAYKAAYDLVGTNPREWEMRTTLEPEKLRVGDVIRYRGNRHSLCVTGVKDNRISFVDCNWYPLCQIRWDSMDLDDMPGFSYVLHDPKNKLKNKNLSFYQPMVDDVSAYLQKRIERDETWGTTAVMNLRRRTSTESEIVSQLPAGITFVVTDKKENNGYLWGKTTYGSAEGWVALDHCAYRHGAVNAPQFLWFSDVRPVNTAFTLFWSSVKGADYYKVFLYDENDACVAKAKSAATQTSFTLNKVGAYYAEVESYSRHAESWVLTGEAMTFRVQKPEDIKITSLKVEKAEATLVPGETDAVRALVRPYCAYKGTLQYSSSNRAVLEVDSLGNLLAVSCGTATVTVKDSRTGLSASCAVTVTPAKPLRLRQEADKLSEESITLIWAKVPQATGYYVYRRKADGHFQYLAATTGNSYSDRGLSDSKEYVYLVKAFCSTKSGVVTGEGSAAATAVTKPAVVQKLTVTPDKGKLTLKWQANSRADSYLVYRAAGKDGKFERVAETTTNRLTLFVAAGKTYSFKVRAVKDSNGKRFASAMSNSASGKAI